MSKGVSKKQHATLTATRSRQWDIRNPAVACFGVFMIVFSKVAQNKNRGETIRQNFASVNGQRGHISAVVFFHSTEETHYFFGY